MWLFVCFLVYSIPLSKVALKVDFILDGKSVVMLKVAPNELLIGAIPRASNRQPSF